jgi:hypothetical protein
LATHSWLRATATSQERTSYLKIILDTELHDARLPRLGRDAVERPGVEVHQRVTPVEVIEEVERLDPQLQRGSGEKKDRRNSTNMSYKTDDRVRFSRSFICFGNSSDNEMPNNR